MPEYTSHAEEYRFEGLTVLRASYRIPCFGSEKANKLYRDLAKRFMSGAESVLFPRICSELGSNWVNNKKHNFGYIYTLNCKCVSVNENTVTVETLSTLKKRNDPDYIKRYKSIEHIRIVDGCLLPEKLVKKHNKSASKYKNIDDNT